MQGGMLDSGERDKWEGRDGGRSTGSNIATTPLNEGRTQAPSRRVVPFARTVARAQFVIRQLVRAKMKSLKKVACQSTKTSLARGSFGVGHWSLAVRSPLRGRFANLPISILDAAPRCRHRSHFVAAADGPRVACACGGRGAQVCVCVCVCALHPRGRLPGTGLEEGAEGAPAGLWRPHGL